MTASTMTALHWRPCKPEEYQRQMLAIDQTFDPLQVRRLILPPDNRAPLSARRSHVTAAVEAFLIAGQLYFGDYEPDVGLPPGVEDFESLLTIMGPDVARLVLIQCCKDLQHKHIDANRIADCEKVIETPKLKAYFESLLP